MRPCLVMVCLPSASRALYFNLLGLLVILVCAVFSGLIMYVYYESCDPWTARLVQAPDQVSFPQ